MAVIRAALDTALRRGVVTDARTGALIALLSALIAVPGAVDPEAVGLSKRELTASASRIAEGDWAAVAVRSAIDSTMAAVIAASASAVVITGSGSS